jgi:hypothetical protein
MSAGGGLPLRINELQAAVAMAPTLHKRTAEVDMRLDALRKALARPATRRTMAAVALVVVCASSALAAPFDDLAEAIDKAGRKWGPALMVLGGLVAGGAIALGSHNAGEKVRNFVIGALFLALAAGGGTALLNLFRHYAR